MKLLIDVNQLLWNGPILVILFGTHVYFTMRLRLVQRKIGYGIFLSLSDGSENQKGFGRFGSLTTTLAATLGTGNIIGISTAVFLGGPGAVFWCWLTGLLGMATTYAETFLCHHFRYQGHGGPMYILHFFLHKKKHWQLFTVPPSHYPHFLSDAPHKATQLRKPAIRSFRFRPPLVRL